MARGTRDQLRLIDEDAAVANYRAIVQIPTVSTIDGAATKWEHFDAFRALLPLRYPLAHSVLQCELHAGHSMLFRWPGCESGDPVILMAHYDVVDPGDLDAWTHPPFAAEIVEGPNGPAVLGRGAIDDKASVTALWEAIEAHVEAGSVPRCDIYLALSHDEETLGAATGTPAIVASLAERGIHPAMVLDEGGIVGEPVLPGAAVDMVLVGVSEKGSAVVRIAGQGEGGHSSVRPEQTVISRLAGAITAMEAAPALGLLNGPTRRLIERVGAGAAGPLGESAAALTASDDVAGIEAFQRVSPFAAAMTTSRPIATEIGGGHAANAVPESGWALVNARVVVGTSLRDVIEGISERVRPYGLIVEDVASFEPSPISPSDGPMWELVETTAQAVYGDVVVAPFVNNGGTDARSYTAISNVVYRFNPFAMTLAERDSLHAVDERLTISAFLDGVRFYRTLLSGLVTAS